MKIYEFPYFISFGRGDNNESLIEYELTDEQTKRLVKSAEEGGRYSLNEDEEIEDVFSDIYEAVIEREKELLRDDPSQVYDFLSWEKDFDPNSEISDEDIERYIDGFNIGINYPVELQMLEAPKKKKSKQSKVDRIILNADYAESYIAEHSGKVKEIILTDNGDTLYYVPPKYSGVFTLPSSIKKIKKNAFFKRTKITEVIIETGIKELPEWAFDSCEALEKITIPASIEVIPFNAFTKCSRLKTVIIEEGVKEIDNTAFRFCFDLNELHIPASVGKVNAYINSYQNGIRHIFFYGMNTGIDDSRGGTINRATFHVRSGSLAERFAIDHDVKYEYI